MRRFDCILWLVLYGLLVEVATRKIDYSIWDLFQLNRAFWSKLRLQDLMKVFHQLEEGFCMLSLQLSNGSLRDHSSGSALLLVNCLDGLIAENLVSVL